MMAAGGLAHIRRQAICNQNEDLDRSAHIADAHTNKHILDEI